MILSVDDIALEIRPPGMSLTISNLSLQEASACGLCCPEPQA